jgi:AAA domain
MGFDANDFMRNGGKQHSERFDARDGDRKPSGGAKAEPAAGLQILSSAQFVLRWVPKSFLLKGIIEESRLLTLCGPTGSGKTAVALLIARHIALGRPLAGLKVRQAGVLYCAGENPDDVRTRWLAMLRREAIDPETIDVRFIEGRFSIEGQLEAIRAHLAERPAGLVIPDTLQAFFNGDDSNSNDQMKAAAFIFREITMAGPAVLIPAHPKTGATRDSNVPYGGGALLNEIDGNLSLWGNPSSVELHWSGKFRGSFEPLHFALDTGPVPDALDADGDPVITVTARTIDQSEAEARDGLRDAENLRLLKAVQDNPGASLQQLADACSAMAGVSGWSKSTVRRKLAGLDADGLVERAAGKAMLSPKGRRFVEKIG